MKLEKLGRGLLASFLARVEDACSLTATTGFEGTGGRALIATKLRFDADVLTLSSPEPGRLLAEHHAAIAGLALAYRAAKLRAICSFLRAIAR
ncbi:MAG TPA: hypothetical protein PLB91_03960 [Spirochaetales bacterium]|nr:hypothetical protein [Spirochaetales bacterium]HRY53456.1 hypothetical protein [Spirochaetia bacterium]